ADAAHYLGSHGGFGERLDAIDEGIAGIGIHAGITIGQGSQGRSSRFGRCRWPVARLRTQRTGATLPCPSAWTGRRNKTRFYSKCPVPAPTCCTPPCGPPPASPYLC